jgi:hypothetical protein
MTPASSNLRPLGSLAPSPGGQPWSAEILDRSAVLSEGLRARVAAYLEGCPVFLAWMEHTYDEIGRRFEVPGGSAIASDGTFYWRLDGVQYIKEYGILVPEEAISHFEALGWEPPSLDRQDYLSIYRELDSALGGGEVVV